MPYSKYIFLIIALSCVFAATSLAQTRETGILVTVKDQFGGTISGAEIALGKSGEKLRQIQTDSLGVGEFFKLAAGEYEITVAAEGFKEYKSREIGVKNGEISKIEIVLEVALVESNVEVGETDTPDAEKSGLTTILNEKEIAGLPDNQEELERTIRKIGEAATGSEDLPITVNGVQGGKIPPKQAIQQIRVNQNVFSSQYDSPYGGGIEIFTRSKVDKYSGYVSFGFADSRFNAADPFLHKRIPYQSRTYYFNLTGPLFGSEKANFFVYGGRSDSDTSAAINAVVLDSDLQPVEYKQTIFAPVSSENIYLNINADPTKKHKLFLGYNLSSSRAKGQNVGGFSLPSRANNANSQGHYLQLSDTYLINPNVVNQTRFLAYYSSTENFGGNNTAAAINVLDAFYGGGSQQDFSNASLRFEAANDTTWQMGKYALGFGWKLRGERINQVSRSNFGGTYTFSGRLAPVLDASNNPVTDNAGNFVTTQISSLESYRRTLLFGRLGFTNRRIRELGGGANQFTISGGNPEIKATQYDYAFYLQNSYKISETVAASFGLRYENQTNIASGYNFAPRFGIIWAPKAKEKQKPLYTLPRVSIGYGVFYNRFALSNIVGVRQASGADRAQYLVTDANVLDSYPVVPSIALLQQFALSQSRRFLDDALEAPYQSLFNVTVAKKLPKKFSLNFTFSHGLSHRQSFTQNINAPLAGTFNPLNPLAAVRPFGNIGNIYQTNSGGRAQTTRYSLNLGFPNTQKLFGGIRYGFTKAKSGVVSGSGSPFDAYDFSQEYAPTAYDGVHSVGGYFFFNLKHKISIGADFSISSGTRFNIFTGRDTNGDGFYSERPAFAADLGKPNLVATPYGVLDPNPSPGDKLIPRNLGRGPANFGFNTYLSKSFGFGEDKKNKKPPKRTLSFNLNIRNVFNIVSKGNPVGNMSSPNFLRTLSSFSDGGIIIINGATQTNFSGRSMNFSIGFGF